MGLKTGLHPCICWFCYWPWSCLEVPLHDCFYWLSLPLVEALVYQQSKPLVSLETIKNITLLVGLVPLLFSSFSHFIVSLGVGFWFTLVSNLEDYST